MKTMPVPQVKTRRVTPMLGTHALAFLSSLLFVPLASGRRLLPLLSPTVGAPHAVPDAPQALAHYPTQRTLQLFRRRL